MNFIKEDEHKANYQGLRDLMSLGDNRCKMEAFTEDVWRELYKVMGLTKDDVQQRMKKYNTKITDPLNTKKSHDRCRKIEDIKIKEDLIHLQKMLIHGTEFEMNRSRKKLNVPSVAFVSVSNQISFKTKCI